MFWQRAFLSLVVLVLGAQGRVTLTGITIQATAVETVEADGATRSCEAVLQMTGSATLGQLAAAHSRLTGVYGGGGDADRHSLRLLGAALHACERARWAVFLPAAQPPPPPTSEAPSEAPSVGAAALDFARAGFAWDSRAGIALLTWLSSFFSSLPATPPSAWTAGFATRLAARVNKVYARAVLTFAVAAFVAIALVARVAAFVVLDDSDVSTNDEAKQTFFIRSRTAAAAAQSAANSDTQHQQQNSQSKQQKSLIRRRSLFNLPLYSLFRLYELLSLPVQLVIISSLLNSLDANNLNPFDFLRVVFKILAFIESLLFLFLVKPISEARASGKAQSTIHIKNAWIIIQQSFSSVLDFQSW
ncbi:hypothetical protein HK100_008527 [Physocladia obscura]|uniref:Uncharacterized protein n=1 Tax=Physocladia obscura TaxID=109957 RepID=A0AAD5T4L4_9FUNG|nr:hypothetical protein HK100_008527 [Physocladia obscura]